jgi:2-dehydro-3-deoxy-D-arabinonate dehydratase
MKLFHTTRGFFVYNEDEFFRLESTHWDEVIARGDLNEHLRLLINKLRPVAGPASSEILPPIGGQEVWAAGVTYFRSRDARMQESKDAGGGSFYDRVYAADRPELFFKATPHRVVGPNDKVAIRSDATWSVPEPELVLYISPGGKIVGYTIGNDMSSRDIEGENPLYLPQAKVYDRSCALGPCLLISEEPLPATTSIEMKILRSDREVFSGATTLKELKRDPQQLVEYLYRNCSFSVGCFLLTGTGIVPPDDFTLCPGDEICITIPPIGTLVNIVG